MFLIVNHYKGKIFFPAPLVQNANVAPGNPFEHVFFSVFDVDRKNVYHNTDFISHLKNHQKHRQMSSIYELNKMSSSILCNI